MKKIKIYWSPLEFLISIFIPDRSKIGNEIMNLTVLAFLHHFASIIVVFFHAGWKEFVFKSKEQPAN